MTGNRPLGRGPGDATRESSGSVLAVLNDQPNDHPIFCYPCLLNVLFILRPPMCSVLGIDLNYLISLGWFGELFNVTAFSGSITLTRSMTASVVRAG